MGSHQSNRMVTDAWLTPPEMLNELGQFTLDPCACPHPRPWNTAKHHYYLPYFNGLTLPWWGRVWLNPPYSRDAVRWLYKMSEHNRGTALLFARTETRWFFDTVWNKASLCLFLEGRVTFYKPNGDKARANSGAPSVLVAYGKEDAQILDKSSIPGARVKWTL